jgi:hypothetical protein
MGCNVAKRTYSDYDYKRELIFSRCGFWGNILRSRYTALLYRLSFLSQSVKGAKKEANGRYSLHTMVVAVDEQNKNVLSVF